MDAASTGEKFLAAGHYDAVLYFNEAIKQSPASPDYYIKRSMAHQKAKSYSQALQDCETAIDLAYKRGNKSTRALAQFRRRYNPQGQAIDSIALSCLQRPKDAKFCLEQAIRDGCTDKSISIWQSKIDKAVALDADGQISVSEIPHLEVANNDAAPGQGKVVDTAVETPLPTPPAYKKPKFEWYQTPSTIIITFYVKNIAKDKCTVDISKDAVSLDFPVPGSDAAEYAHEFEPLFDSIDPVKSSHRVLSTKLEITLHKSVADRKWPTLERSAVETKENVALQYPTSSKSGPKNWDSLGTSAAGQEAEAAEDGDAALTNLFQTLYKDADEDTKKAMIKSYTESGGTSLSTDWKSVRKGTVEVKPPEGMEARKYER